jgi:hypothetical protein
VYRELRRLAAREDNAVVRARAEVARLEGELVRAQERLIVIEEKATVVSAAVAPSLGEYERVHGTPIERNVQ